MRTQPLVSFGRIVAVAGLLLANAANAQTSDVRTTAASAFDRGVGAFERAEYREAAKAFLEADALVPNTEALGNALVAAERANEHLLVAEASRRASSRQDASPELAARARRALSESSRKLSLVELSCEPEPCMLRVDGTVVLSGERYLLPGTHRFESSGGEGATTEERITLDAGARYRVVLYPVRPGVVARAAAVTEAEGASSGPPPPEASKTKPPPAAPMPPEDRAPLDDKPVSPTVFYVGVGVTVALAAVTTWSGVDTLSRKSDLGEAPTRAEVDAVQSRIVRTDVLLGATVLLAAATTYAGFALVDFGSARVAPGGVGSGAGLAVSGSF